MQSSHTKAQVQKVLITTGPAMFVAWIVGFVFFAKFIPVPDPNDTPLQVLERFQRDTNMIRVGLWMVLFTSPLLLSFAAVISAQMKRIEGDPAPLSMTQLGSAAALTLEFIFPLMIWMTATYRPYGRSPETMQTLNDMGWLMFVMIICTVLLQFLAIAYAVLTDDAQDPILPRWTGYLNIWVAILVFPAGLVVFFKSGPFAWNGLFAWYIPLAVYGIWMFAMASALWKAVDKQLADTTTPATNRVGV